MMEKIAQASTELTDAKFAVADAATGLVEDLREMATRLEGNGDDMSTVAAVLLRAVLYESGIESAMLRWTQAGDALLRAISEEAREARTRAATRAAAASVAAELVADAEAAEGLRATATRGAAAAVTAERLLSEVADTVPCPCCGKPMESQLVVCWGCYRATNRLYPGTYTIRSTGETVDLTVELIDAWDAAQVARNAARGR